MSAEQQDFEALRRLMALKRHEQPPPGYFEGFSRQVIAGIQAAEAQAGGSFLSRWLAPLHSLWMGFEAKPIVAGAFGVGVCGLLVIGLVTSERMDNIPGAYAPNGNTESPQTIFANVPGNQTSIGSYFDHAVRERVGTDQSSTGSVFTAQTRTSIFDEIRPHVQPVNFSVPAN